MKTEYILELNVITEVDVYSILVLIMIYLKMIVWLWLSSYNTEVASYMFKLKVRCQELMDKFWQFYLEPILLLGLSCLRL